VSSRFRLDLNPPIADAVFPSTGERGQLVECIFRRRLTSEVFYQMSEFYNQESARGVHCDDPAFQIIWPAKVEVISERNRTFPNFESMQCAY
jgi:hypothetical protein